MIDLEKSSLDDIEIYLEKNIDKLKESELETIYAYVDKIVRQDSYDKFIEYNEQDVSIVTGIDNKLKFIQLAIAVAHMTKSKLSDIFGTVKLWDNLLYNMLLLDNVVIPPEKFNQSESFEGAYVKDALAGFFKWLISVDLTSLYPSIIMMLNMSPETLVDHRADDTMSHMYSMLDRSLDTAGFKKRNLAIAANGTSYRLDKVGIIPRAMKMLFDSRKSVKTSMKVDQKQLESAKAVRKDHPDIPALEISIAMKSAKEQALKVLTNGGYGAIGNSSFRYFLEEIAEGITLTGQLAIRYIANKNNEYMRNICNNSEQDYVLMVDTDSNYIWLEDWVNQNVPDQSDVNHVVDKINEFCLNKFEPHIDESFLNLSEYMNAPKNYLDMKREAIADKILIRAKKNYVIQIYDNEGVRFKEPKVKFMGVETAKSNTAKVIRKALEEGIKIVLNGTEEDIRKFEKDFHPKFYNTPLNEIAKPTGVSNIEKWRDKNGDPIKGTPYHVKASILYNKLISSDPELSKKYQKIKSDDKIKLLNLKKANPVFNNYIAFHDELPPELELDIYIDKDKQYNDTFISPLVSFVTLRNWELYPKMKLTDLFDDKPTDNGLTPIKMVEETKKPVRKKKTKSLNDLF